MPPVVPSPPLSPSVRALLVLPLRVGLGLFVLWQVVFLCGYNLVELSSAAQEYLGDQRKAWLKKQSDESVGNGDKPDADGAVWERVTDLPLVGGAIEEWIEQGEKSVLGRRIARAEKVTDWYAKRSGLEQGWSLFAPDTVDWSCMVAVEMRWDDDPEPGGKKPPPGAEELVPEPVELYSDNEPRDRRRYVRWGYYRFRKFESSLEVRLTRKHYATEEEAAVAWESRCRKKKEGRDGKSILVYLRWKLRHFMEKHPGLDPPRQVILRSRCWNIPAPPGPSPWDWEFEQDVPMVRWRPWRHKPTSPDVLEVYLHTEKRFESNPPTRWQTHTPPANPWSAD